MLDKNFPRHRPASLASLPYYHPYFTVSLNTTDVSTLGQQQAAPAGLNQSQPVPAMGSASAGTFPYFQQIHTDSSQQWLYRTGQRSVSKLGQ